MITDEKMEKLIAELYEENIQEMEVPVDIDVEAHLDRAYRELEAKEKEEAAAARKIRFKRVVRAAVVFIGVLVFSLVVFQPEQGYADVFRFMFDRGSEENMVIKDNLIGEESEGEIEVILVSLEDLDSMVGFHVPLPTYLPEGYNITHDTKITKGYNEVFSIYISYIEKGNWEMLMYNIMPIKNKSAHSAVLDITKEKTERITINEDCCYIYSDEENERITLYWEWDEYMYSIDGNISKEEAIKIVESIE